MWLEKTSKVTLQGTVGELRQRMREIRKNDKAAEKNAKVGCNFGCGGCLFACLLMGRVMMFELDIAGAVGKGILACTIVSLIGLAFKWYYDSYDLDNARQAVVRQLLKFLAVDARPTSRSSLALDFGDHTDAKYRSGDSFSQTWMDLQTRLIDGVKVEISVTRRGKKTEKTKSKGSKTRVRFREIVAISLDLPAGRYPNIEAIPDFLKEDKLAWSSAQSAVLKGRRLTVKIAGAPCIATSYRSKSTSSMDGLWTGAQIAQALVWVFRAVKRAKDQTIGRALTTL